MFAKGSFGPSFFPGDTNPDGIGGSFSGAFTPDMGPGAGDPGWTGFGPGDYGGGYTGKGDAVYWGLFGDDPIVPMPPAILNSNTRNHPVGDFGPAGVAPAAPVPPAVPPVPPSTSGIQSTPTLPDGSTRSIMSGSASTTTASTTATNARLAAANKALAAARLQAQRLQAMKAPSGSGSSGVSSGSSGTDGTMGGSIEMQNLGTKKLTTRQIFEEYYVEASPSTLRLRSRSSTASTPQRQMLRTKICRTT